MDVAQMGCRARKKSRKWHFPSPTFALKTSANVFTWGSGKPNRAALKTSANVFTYGWGSGKPNRPAVAAFVSSLYYNSTFSD